MADFDYSEDTRFRLECLDCPKVFAFWTEAKKHQNKTGHKVKYNLIHTD